MLSSRTSFGHVRMQVLLRHGQLCMYSNREVVRSGKDGRGMFVVINGLVRIGYQDPLGNTQEYFLGTGAALSRILGYRNCLK